ncbi:MAG: hypothetical protein IT164_12205 [Bryobacterales bacterium]|nr:hypothetical protein [Bryobacterales bacterium]
MPRSALLLAALGGGMVFLASKAVTQPVKRAPGSSPQFQPAATPAFAQPESAPPNTLTISNQSGADQTNVPVQFGRPFLDNEIMQFPQVVADARGGGNCKYEGTPLKTQANVKQRYRSGAVRHAILAIVLPCLGAKQSITISFQNNAQGNTEPLPVTSMLDASYDFEARMAMKARCPDCPDDGWQTASARAMVESGLYSEWTPGQVAQTILIADHTGKRNDLGWKPARITTLTQATNAEGVLLVENASDWPVPMVIRVRGVNNDTTNNNRDGERILINEIDTSSTPHRLVLPRIERIRKTGDQTWEITTFRPHGLRENDWIFPQGVQGLNLINNIPFRASSVTENTLQIKSSRITGDYTAGGYFGRRHDEAHATIPIWAAGQEIYPDLWSPAGEDAYKSFRPVFHATFWPDLNKVRVRFIGEIADTERAQDLMYSISLRLGRAADQQVFSELSVVHGAGARWTREYWIGGPPPLISLNHNLAYLAATGFLANYDPAKEVSGEEIDAWYNAWTAHDFDRLFEGPADPGSATLMSKAMAQPGNLLTGLYPEYTVAYLYRDDPRLQRIFYGNTDRGGGWPIHFREGQDNRLLTRPADRGCAYQCEQSGLGRVVSLTSRPTVWLRNLYLSGKQVNEPADRIAYTGTFTAGSFSLGMNHFWNPYPITYAVSGDFWYLEEAWFWASFAAGYAKPGQAAPGGRGPTGAEGGFPGERCVNGAGYAQDWEIRTTGWIIRQRAETAFVSPDDTPEKSYFETLTRDAAAQQEGYQGVAKSLDENSYNAIYDWAKTWQNENWVGACGLPPTGGYSRGEAAFVQGLPANGLIYGIDRAMAVTRHFQNQRRVEIADGVCPASSPYSAPCKVSSCSFAYQNGGNPSFEAPPGTAAGSAYVYVQPGDCTVQVAHDFSAEIPCKNCVATRVANPGLPSGAIPLAKADFDGSMFRITDLRNFSVAEANAQFSQDWLVMSLGRAQELGFPFRNVLARVARHYTGFFTDPSANPWMLHSGRFPTIKRSDGSYYKSHAEMMEGWDPHWRTVNKINTNAAYYATSSAASAYLAEFPAGDQLWSWQEQNALPHIESRSRVSSIMNYRLNYAIRPRTGSPARPGPNAQRGGKRSRQAAKPSRAQR